MSELPLAEERAARRMVIDSQPEMWTRAMLEAAEKAKTPDARDAILGRIGAELFTRYSMIVELHLPERRA